MATTSVIDTRNTASASRRNAWGERKETPTITASAGGIRIAWRLTKWNMSLMPMRSATAGLAASSSTMPISISARMVISMSRSTVHHQELKAERSVREAMNRRSVN